MSEAADGPTGAEEPPPLPSTAEITENQMEELRSYQQCALQRARERNVIMVGSTGIGKTLVAIKLLQEQDYTDGRIAFFLVPTRTLAHQQFLRVKKCTKLKVSLAVGSDVTLWKKKAWVAKLSHNNVIISTAQVLLNLLDKGREYLTMERLNLLIIDECHRASKQHPYNKIMQLYDPDAEVKPKVFGMTAVPTANCGENMHCTYIICPQWQVQSFAANAPLEVRHYLPHKAEDAEPLHDWALTTLLDDIRATCPAVEELRDTCKLDQVRPTFHELGAWCGLRHLVLTLSYFLYSSNVGKRTSSVFLHPISNMTTYMARMISRRPAKPTAIVPQLKRLIEILRQKRAEDPDNYRAMVFVQRRIVCRTICEYLRLLPDFRGRTSFVTGQSSNDAISSFGAKSFTRTMHDFACGEIDTLIATNVLSEGIDVPDCSVVVVYDDLKDVTTFVQMRGRARKKTGGSFMVMVANEKEEGMVKKLEGDSTQFNSDRFLVDNVKREPESSMPLRSQFTDFIYRVESTGAELNLDNAIPYIHMLCQRTKECQKYGLGPIFDVEADEKFPDLHRCKLTLPAFFKVRTVTTNLFKSKTVARAVAAFEATVLLHHRGLIDDSFNPPQQSRLLNSYKEFRVDLEIPDRCHLKEQTWEHLGLHPLPLTLPPEPPSPTHDEADAVVAEDGERGGGQSADDGAMAVSAEAAGGEKPGASAANGHADKEGGGAEASAVAAGKGTVAASDSAEKQGQEEGVAVAANGKQASEEAAAPVVANGHADQEGGEAEAMAVDGTGEGGKQGGDEGAAADSTEKRGGEAEGEAMAVDGGSAGEQANGKGSEAEQKEAAATTTETEGSEEEEEEGEKTTLWLYGIRGTTCLALGFAGELRVGSEYDDDDPYELTASPLRLEDKGTIEVTRQQVDMAAQFAALLSYHGMYGRQPFLVQSDYHLKEGQSVYRPHKDKGYLLLPLDRHGNVHWHAIERAVKQPVVPSLWPLPDGDRVGSYIALSHYREPQRPRLFALRKVLDETVGERLSLWKERDRAAAREIGLHVKELMDADELAAEAAKEAAEESGEPVVAMEVEGKGGADDDVQGVEDDEDEDGVKIDSSSKRSANQEAEDSDREEREEQKGWDPKSLVCKTLDRFGEEIRLEPCYPLPHWEAADPKQPLILALKIDESSRHFRNSLRGERHHYPRRIVTVAPQYLTWLRLPSRCYLEIQRLLPLLYKWEADRIVRELIHRMDICKPDPRGLELMREATTKPNYERLETLGDSYLKAQIGLVVFRITPVLEREGLMSAFRDNLACNRRLFKCAQEKGLSAFLHLRKAVVNEPFKLWNPPLVYACEENHEVQFKTVSDICESLLGAHLIHNGHVQADRFLNWLGLPTACGPKCAGLKARDPEEKRYRHKWAVQQRDCHCWDMTEQLCVTYGFGPPGILPTASITKDLADFEDLLGYVFHNKWLLLQALTHPSYGRRPWPTQDERRKTVTLGDYQRLEFLGDALLDYMCMAHFFTMHPGWDPGRLTAEKSALVGNSFLAWVAADQLLVHKFMYYDSIEFGQMVSKYVLLNERDPDKAPKALADIVEALAAAVYIDAGGDFQTMYSVFFPLLSRVPDGSKFGRTGADCEFKMMEASNKLGRKTVRLLKSMFVTMGAVVDAAVEGRKEEEEEWDDSDDDLDGDTDEEEEGDEEDEDAGTCGLQRRARRGEEEEEEEAEEEDPWDDVWGTSSGEEATSTEGAAEREGQQELGSAEKEPEKEDEAAVPVPEKSEEKEEKGEEMEMEDEEEGKGDEPVGGAQKRKAAAEEKEAAGKKTKKRTKRSPKK